MTQDIFGRKFFHPSEAMSLILKDLDRQSSSLSWGRNRPYQLIFKALNDQTRVRRYFSHMCPLSCEQVQEATPN